MTWKQLQKCNIEDIAGYINEKISDGISVNKLAIELGTKEGNIRGYLKHRGYHRPTEKEVGKGVPRLFVKKDDTCNQRVIIQENTINNECNTECNTHDIHDENTLVIHDEYIMNNMIYLSQETDTLRDMIEWFKSKDDTDNTSVIEVKNGIQINLPESNIKRTTIRINETIWDEFDEFVESNRPYEKHTLMAQALKEFMDKHK